MQRGVMHMRSSLSSSDDAGDERSVPMQVGMSLPGLGEPICFAFSGGERDHIASLVSAHGLVSYEAPTPAVLAGLIREVSGLVLDIGANTGIFTLLAAATRATARVCAFEPLESARKQLHTNIACNPRMAPRIAVSPLALSHRRAVAPFFETINDHGLISTSSTLEQGHAIQVGNHVRREVATETLDDWMEASDEGPIGLMKIDVEGHEHAVVEGGRQTIRRDRPIIIIEILGAAEVTALNSMLAKRDYRDFVLSPVGLRWCPRIVFHAGFWNHLLCPVEKIGVVSTVCQRIDLRFENA
jgi:FkbM family methyltransferase